MDKDFKVSKRDLTEFNYWTKGRINNIPRLRGFFNSDKEYEDYMYNYQQEHLTVDNDPAIIGNKKNFSNYTPKIRIRYGIFKTIGGPNDDCYYRGNTPLYTKSYDHIPTKSELDEWVKSKGLIQGRDYRILRKFDDTWLELGTNNFSGVSEMGGIQDGMSYLTPEEKEKMMNDKNFSDKYCVEWQDVGPIPFQSGSWQRDSHIFDSKDDAHKYIRESRKKYHVGQAEKRARVVKCYSTSDDEVKYGYVFAMRSKTGDPYEPYGDIKIVSSPATYNTKKQAEYWGHASEEYSRVRGAKVGYLRVYEGDESDAREKLMEELRDKKFSTTDQLFSDREKVSKEQLDKIPELGVVQMKPNGSWGIISEESGEWWTPDYESEEKAKNALAAYHANKFESKKFSKFSERTQKFFSK